MQLWLTIFAVLGPCRYSSATPIPAVFGESEFVAFCDPKGCYRGDYHRTARSSRLRGHVSKPHELSFFEPHVAPLIFEGKHKWLGGAVDETDGCIYGIPSHSSEVICLSPASDNSCKCGYHVRTIPLPTSVAKGKFKWLRGIICNGTLFGIPAWAISGVLKVDIDQLWGRRSGRNQDELVTLLPLPVGAHAVGNEMKDNGSDLPRRWLWHGAALNANKTAIYCIPSNAESVLKIDLESSQTSLLPIPLNRTMLKETNKWYGGILGNDNAIYGVPYAAEGVLRVDANTDTVSVLGSYGVRQYNWHGGIKSPTTGAIYAFPAHSNTVLKIETNPNLKKAGESRLSQIPIHRASYDEDKVTRYKWLGGALGSDGAIYGMPSDASSVLRIDESDVATTFGVVSGEKNKWQGGVLGRDGFVYAIPSNAKHVLRIDTRPETWKKDDDGRSKVSLLGELPPEKDKWQGGFVARDGRIFGIPENFDKIMKLTPQKPGPEGDCDVLEGRVTVEYL